MNFNANNKFTPEFLPSQVKFQSDPYKYIRSLNPTQIATVSCLIKVGNIYGYIYPGQKRIADRAGVSIRTVNTYLKMLHEDGLLYKKFNQRHTCYYYLHPLFYEKWFREKFSNLLNCLNWVPLILLLSATISNHVFGQMHYGDNYRSLNKKRTYLKKQHNTYTNVNTSIYVESEYTNVRHYKESESKTNRKEEHLQHYNVNKKERSMLSKLASESETW